MQHNREKFELLCQAYGVFPTKLKGQNFLLDEDILHLMVEAGKVTADDVVIEAGPGFGTLTLLLSQKAKKVVAIELDERLFGALQAQLHGQKNIELIFGDVLQFSPEKQSPGEYKVVSNLPYSITSHFLRIFLSRSDRPKFMALLLQKEVAERACAKPGDLSLLGFSVQFYSEPTILHKVPRTAFWPEPKVDSAIITFRTHPQSEIDKRLKRCGLTERELFRLVKFGFSAKRKQLHNNLSAGLTTLLKRKVGSEDIKECLTKVKIHPQSRAQDLSVDDWLELTKILPRV